MAAAKVNIIEINFDFIFKKYNQYGLKSPSILDLKGKTLIKWKNFKQNFLLYLEVSEKSRKSGKPKETLLLCTFGDDCLDIFNAFKWEDYKKDNFDFISN